MEANDSQNDGQTDPPKGDKAKRKFVSPASFVPPSIDELSKLIPGYEFIEFIDKGGMGAIYKARQPQLDRTVAIKLLPPNFGKEHGFDKRFRREARTMASLSHPNLVSVHDFGETREGHLYFVMEFVEGSDLRHLIRNHELQANQILPIINQVCDALQYAHDHGIIHRDIKPANILIDTKGKVKVGDFGLAKLSDNDRDLSKVSAPGVSVGTPAYMSPEAVEDSEIDHRTDIYSLGVVIYEMLTGTVPKGAWAPPSQCAGTDQRFDEVVNRAMQSNRDDRYQRASDLSHAFDSDQANSRGASSRPPATLLRKLTTALVAIALTGSLGFLAISWQAGNLPFRDPGNSPPAPLSTIEFEQVSRQLANWVFRKGGFLQIRTKDENIYSSAELPDGVFEIWRISLENRSEFTDADLKVLVDFCYRLPEITNINLQSTAITPLGAAELSRLSDRLHGLNIANTQAVSDNCIDVLGKFSKLDLLVLSVFEQPAGSQFPALTHNGSERLRNSLPECTIDWRIF